MDKNKQLYEKQSNQYNPFFPIIRLEDIIETSSDKSIQWIFNNYNHIYVEYSESVAITRNKVPSLLRRNGLWISYNTGKDIVTELYKGKNTDITVYEQWTDDANWTKFEPLAYGAVTYQHLNDALKELVNKKVNIYDFPDEEDITTDGTVLSFKDREYDTNNFSGLGRVILRKNIILDDGVYKNVLTQDMINKSNTIYEIRYDFDLNGEEIIIPEGCVLDFQGGSLSNGSVVGNSTVIKAELVKIFGLDIEFDGSWNIAEVYLEWFGAKGDAINDDTTSIQKCFEFADLCNSIIYINKTNNYYKISNPIILENISNIFIDSNFAEIRLDGVPNKNIKTSISGLIETAILCISGSVEKSGNVNIKNLILNGKSINKISNIDEINNNTQILNGIFIDYSNIFLENITINNCFGTGCRILNSSYININNIILNNVGGRPGTSSVPNNDGFDRDNFGDAIYIGYTNINAQININNIIAKSYTDLGYKSRAGLVLEYCKGQYSFNMNNAIFDFYAKPLHIEEQNANGNFYYFNNILCTNTNISINISTGDNNYYEFNNCKLNVLDDSDGREAGATNFITLFDVNNPNVIIKNSVLNWDKQSDLWCNVYNIHFFNCDIFANNKSIFFVGNKTYFENSRFHNLTTGDVNTFYSGSDNIVKQYLINCEFIDSGIIKQTNVRLYNFNSIPSDKILESGNKTKFDITKYNTPATYSYSIPLYHIGNTYSGYFELYLYVGLSSDGSKNKSTTIKGEYIINAVENKVEVYNVKTYGSTYTISVNDLTITMDKKALNISYRIDLEGLYTAIFKGFVK